MKIDDGRLIVRVVRLCQLHNGASLFHLQTRLWPIFGEVRQLFGIHGSSALPSSKRTNNTDTLTPTYRVI